VRALPCQQFLAVRSSRAAPGGNVPGVSCMTAGGRYLSRCGVRGTFSPYFLSRISTGLSTSEPGIFRGSGCLVSAPLLHRQRERAFYTIGAKNFSLTFPPEKQGGWITLFLKIFYVLIFSLHKTAKNSVNFMLTFYSTYVRILM